MHINSRFLFQTVRSRRSPQSPDDSNVSIVPASYVGNEAANTEGLRVYDAFFQHQDSREIPQDPGLRRRTVGPRKTSDPTAILPHHR